MATRYTKDKKKRAVKTFTASQIATLAREIAVYLPKTAVASLAAGKIPFTKRKGGKSAKYINPMVVDTSVLVDGRIMDVVKSGFLFGTFLVIPSVVSELHQLSDSADSLKRARGRRGLDILGELSKNKKIKLELLSKEPEGSGVDEKLVKLAKKSNGKLVTVDFNLSKVAAVSKIKILNLNELAHALKTAVLPHEVLRIKINSVGKEKNQGVGYLDDGTMVVVEGGAGRIGRTVNVEVLRVLQTAAGKMIFGKIATSD